MSRPAAAPSISFSTLACPEWDPDRVVERAAALGYDGIEWRGGPDGHVSVAWDAGRRAALRTRMADAGVTPLAVTAYSVFTSPDPAEREANLDHLRRHARLAHDLGAPFVRTFLGFRTDDASDDEMTARLDGALRIAAGDAAGLGVTIVVEPHDDFVRASTVAAVLAALDHAAVGAIWDVGNAWAEGEHPADGWAALGDRVRYLQVKDGRHRDGRWELTRLGEGTVPLAEALTTAARRGPLPPVSLEWERAWHPELDPADVALGPALDAIRSLVATAAATAAVGA